MKRFISFICAMGFAAGVNAADIGMLASDCVNRTANDIHLATFLEVEGLPYNCIDPSDIEAGYNLTAHKMLYTRSGSNDYWLNPDVIDAIDSATRGGVNMVMEYSGTNLAQWLDLGRTSHTGHGTGNGFTKNEVYFVEPFNDNPILGNLPLWSALGIQQGNDPNQLIHEYTRADEAKNYSYFLFNEGVIVDTYSFWGLWDRGNVDISPLNSDWCLENPGVCMDKRSVVKYGHVDHIGDSRFFGTVYASVQHGSGTLYFSGVANTDSDHVRVGPIGNQIRRNLISEALKTGVEVAERIPVIIVPGIFGSWSEKMFNDKVPEILDVEFWLRTIAIPLGKAQNWNIPYEWTLDPISGTYDQLRSFLKRKYGNNMVHDFPYDWRQSIADSADELGAKIADILAQTEGANRVRIVAHSMGGLVVRHYMTKSMPEGVDSDIEAVAMIGTPQLGSSDVYQILEEGEFITSWFDLGEGIGKEIILKNMKQAYGYKGGKMNDRRFIKDLIPSIAQLMPTYMFVRTKGKDLEGERVKGWILPVNLCERNVFLEDLNQEIETLMLRSTSTRKALFISRDVNTTRNIETNDRTVGIGDACEDYAPDGKYQGRWPSGSIAGDGRVPYGSAVPRETTMFSGPQNLFVPFRIRHEGEVRGLSAKHGDLPSNRQLLNKLRKFLDGERVE